jgi:autotransporter-associated beta strand protein
MKPKSILRLSTIALAFSSAHAAPLLTDNFNDANFDASTFNNNLASTQGGSLAPVSYSVSYTPGNGYTVQHGNGGNMLVVDNGGIQSGRASLNHDFALEANLADKPLSISFKVTEVIHSADPSVWGHFGLGSSQNADFFGTDFSMLIRSNGNWNARDNNAAADLGVGTYADGDLITFVFSNTAGTGSAFNGNGSKVTITVGTATPVTYTLNQLAAGDGFLTWGGYTFGEEFMVMAIDNLSVDMDATFPAGEAMVWAGAINANWDETTANWSNVNTFTKWFNNPGTRNNAVFNATGSGQPNVSFALTRPLEVGSLTFETAGYTLGGTATLGNSLNLVANADATISATLGGSAGITKSGASTVSLTGPSSYSGVTTLQDGVLNAASFADNGANSSLGAGTGDTNLEAIGLLFRGGSLQYTGSTPQSTNRAVRLSTIGGGGTIDASGSTPSATLSFTSANSPNFFEYPGSRTLTLTGSNTGDNTFAMAIGQAGGLTSVVKNGSGKWVLTGANTYSGDTTINGGTLSLTSAYLDNASLVTIASGAKLNLNYTGNDVIGSLEINGSGPLPGGIYNSSHPTYGSYFTGTGSLLVLNGANGLWTSLVDGIWDDTSNWSSGTIASGFDQSATFNAATGVTVTLSGTKTIGSLIFDTSDYTLAGPSTLTLDSSSVPTVSVATGRTATIAANLDGVVGMEKTGAGKLVLTGTKSYTGGTIVTGGTLELSGATGGNAQIHGSLTVSAGATLAFTNGDGTGFGFFNNPVNSTTVDGGTINAISGSHLGFGPFTTMTMDNGAVLSGSWQWNGDDRLSFFSYGNSTNTISGNVVLRSDNGASHTFNVDDGASATDLLISANLSDQSPETWWVSPSGLTKGGTGTLVLGGTNSFDGHTVVNEGVLEISPASSLRFRPTTNGVTNSVSGSATGSLRFLGTISLDLGAVNATAGNVWNLFNLASFTGPAPTLTPSTVTTTTLGSFTEVSPGNWELPVSGAKWVFTEADGNLAYMVAATDYDTWATTNGVTGGENDDDDNDGLTNNDEYAFGLDPTGGSSVNPIAVQLDKTTGTFSYTRRLLSLTGLTYTIWYSTDLSVWTQDAGAVQGTPSVSGEVETVPVTLSGTLLTHSKLFVQVRAE